MSQNAATDNGAVWELAVGASDYNSEVRSQDGSSEVCQKLHESSKKVHVNFEKRESGGLLAISYTTSGSSVCSSDTISDNADVGTRASSELW